MSIVLILLIIPNSCFATTQQNPTISESGSNYLFWEILATALAIAIYGSFKSNRREITVFANYTDIVFVFASIFVPLIVFIIMRWANSSLNISYWVFSIIFVTFFIAIIKATFLYNNGNILNFLLALYTKMFIPLVLVACVIIAFILSAALSRNKYERKTSYSKRQTGTIIAGFGVGLLAAAWVLHDEEFVSIKNYLSGKS